MVMIWDKDGICLCEKCHLLYASAALPSTDTTPLCAGTLNGRNTKLYIRHVAFSWDSPQLLCLSCVILCHVQPLYPHGACTHTHEGNQPEQQRDDVEKERET